MPVTGRKPKEEAERRTRVRPVHDWTEVVDLPYTGKRPGLPSVREVVTRKGDLVELPVHRLTRAWWRSISRMPHCILWESSDWQFALATAIVADQAFRGSSSHAAELRQRERIIGTTLDARRDLRIRYVDPDLALAATGTDGAPAPVTHLDERRQRLLAAEEASAGDDAP